MKLYTERQGIRKPIEPTNNISIDVYATLLDICKSYYKYLTHLYKSKKHHDFTNKDYIVLDENKFKNRMKTRIPDLYKNENGEISQPCEDDEYNQYALIDFIEFIAKNIKDIKEGWNNGYKNYWEIVCLDTDDIFNKYKKAINEIFVEGGVLFHLTDDKVIERIVENTPLTLDMERQVNKITEEGVKKLLEDAIALYKTPAPTARQDSVEKIWDALERLKTYYDSHKKKSVTKIIEDMSDGDERYHSLFENEFSILTKIGNEFRIRHHEIDKIDIEKTDYYDYFFNRCLSLIAIAIKYLK